MARHQLSLEVPQTNNTRIFRITDTSVYADELPVKCPVLHITSPGFTIPVAIEVLKSFNLVLNACTLGLSSGDCEDSMPSLPDGVYHIRYSVSPNDKVFVEYYHLRTSQVQNVLHNEICKLDLDACEPPQEIAERFKKLSEIGDYIEAARIKTEICHDPVKGMKLLLYAKDQLERIVNGCSTC